MYLSTNTMEMNIQIAETRHLKEVQQDFNNYFPFLKIEFFRKQHGVEKPSPAQRMFSHSMTVSEARTSREEGLLEVKPAMTVAELEQSFWKQFGLAVQVFRKSGNLWLETTMTDKWTLDQQNNHGREISTETTNPKTNASKAAEDFELNRGED